MFMGHYGVALAAKAIYPEIPLGALIVATQAVDIAWATLVLTGAERVTIDPEANPTVPLRLGYMPYSHGLTGALGISAVVAVGGGILIGGGGIVLFWVCFSHWLLDLVVHDRDLPLVGNRYKVGFGLWQHPWLARGLEYGVLVVGAGMYLSTFGGSWGSYGVIAVAAVIQTASFFGAPPRSVPVLCLMMLAVFFAFALAGLWIEPDSPILRAFA